MKSEKNNIRQIANESNREHNFEICFEIYISFILPAKQSCRLIYL